MERRARISNLGSSGLCSMFKGIKAISERRRLSEPRTRVLFLLSFSIEENTGKIEIVSRQLLNNRSLKEFVE